MYTDIIYILCSTALIIMGIYALFENYKSKSNRSFFLMSFFAALWIIFLYLMYISGNSTSIASMFVKLANGMTLLALYFISCFFYFFPRKTININIKFQYLFSIFIFILFLITISTSLVQDGVVIKNGQIISETYGILFPLFLIVIIGFLFMLTLFVYKKLQTLHGIEKTKIKIVSFSFILVSTFAIIANVILPQFEILFLIKESVIFTLFFIGPTLYAIQKHRFFHISYVALNLLRWFVFIATLLIIILVYNQFSYYLSPNLGELHRIIIISILSILTFMKIKDYFPKFINKNLRELKNIIQELKHKLYYCNSFKNLVEYLENTFIDKLNIKHSQIYLVRKKMGNFNIPIYKKDDFTKIISHLKKNIILISEVDYLNISKNEKFIIKKSLKKSDALLCVPLFAEHKLIGLLILGEKNKKESYSKEEIKEIVSIKNVLEICLMNLLLKQNLQEENNLMKEIIEKKTEELREQFKEIKMLLEQQSDFIAITAHEFRTPLSIALFQLEDTLNSYKHTPQVIEDMKVMDSSLKNLKNLTQKLFDVQQYDLNKVKLRKEKIEITKFLKQIFNEFNLVAKEQKVEFKFNNKLKKEIEIDIDTHQIRQVLNNLLNNALKFTDNKNSKITLELSETNKIIQISITDNGQGVPDKDKTRIFEKFQTKKVNMGTGIGLGLYICKKIIELHKGQIWVEDCKQGGAKFIFELRK